MAVSRSNKEDASEAPISAEDLHLQKLATLGVMASGVAHDFRNFLSIILGYSTLVLDSLPLGSQARSDLEEVLRAGEQATELVGQLLGHARRDQLRARPVDLRQVLSERERMLASLLGESITLSLEHEPTAPTVRADPAQISQIIMSLAINARDAMPSGGWLSISTATTELDDGSSARRSLRPGTYVVLEVKDSGTGMDEATRLQVFEPFFTTKSPTNGTGLGLALVKQIVEQNGGRIEVDSELGRGTRFRLLLPHSDARVESVPQLPPATVKVHGSETILLVEDDAQVRGAMRAILGRHGYTVLDTAGPSEAILICETHPGPIELLIADVVMPRMPGTELARRLAPLRPLMRALFVSGSTETFSPGGLSFLPKPPRPDALLAKVREALAGASLGAALGVPLGLRPG